MKEKFVICQTYQSYFVDSRAQNGRWHRSSSRRNQKSSPLPRWCQAIPSSSALRWGSWIFWRWWFPLKAHSLSRGFQRGCLSRWTFVPPGWPRCNWRDALLLLPTRPTAGSHWTGCSESEYSMVTNTIRISKHGFSLGEIYARICLEAPHRAMIKLGGKKTIFVMSLG